MIEFFVLLIVLMVLAVALGSWMRPGRQVMLDRQPVVRRRRLVRERRYY